MASSANRIVPRSLQVQAILLLLVAVGVTLILATRVFSNLFAVQFEQEIEKRGRAMVQTLAKHTDLRLALALADAARANPVLADIARDDDVRYVAILGPKHRVLAWAPASMSQAAVEDNVSRQSDDEGGLEHLHRFAQTVARSQDESGGLDFSGATQPEDTSLGTIVLGLSADNATQRLRLQTVVTVVATGLLVVLLFVFYFGWVTRRLRRMVQFAGWVSEGDLTRQLDDPLGDELGGLASSLRQMSSRTGSVVKELQDASRLLSTNSSEVLQSSSRQAATATKQAAAVAEMGATITQLREIFKQATTKTEVVIDLANRSEQSSSGGTQAVNDSVESMDHIREQVMATAQTMQGLAQKADQIGAIIEVVKDISEQSRMLALNAGIEAVRSGEHGRGFAVVAREMRSLADRSKESTDQVRNILQDIQVSVRNAVGVSEEGRRRAESGMKVATAAGDAIKLLAETIAASSRAATQIAAATRQQGAGIEQIWQASRDIDRTANETAAGIQQLEKAAGNMKQLADGMSGIVGRYQINGSGAEAS